MEQDVKRFKAAEPDVSITSNLSSDSSNALQTKSDGKCTDFVSRGKKKKTNIADEFDPGAVRKVKLENFVTYGFAEFTFGPCLNMIIGPNGTGKSTVVCAICLGLGGKPEILGRVKQASDFIRTGETKATITIELQGHTKHQTITIRRVIEGQNSSWFLNNKHSSLKEIKRVTDGFNIMMDNLCQFLPQDKVALFAKLPANELLIETERAVGSQSLVQFHEQLIELDEKQTALTSDLDSNKTRLADLLSRQAEEESKMARIKERQKLKQEHDMLVKAHAFLEFRDLKKDGELLKVQKAEAEDHLKAMESLNQEFINLAEAAREKQDYSTQKYERTKSKMNAQIKHVKAQNDRTKQLSTHLQENKVRLKTAAKQKREQERNRQELASKIEKLKELIKRTPAHNPQEIVRIKELLRQTQDEIRQAEYDCEAHGSNVRQIAHKGEILRDKKLRHTRRLNDLDSVFNQQLENVRRFGKLGSETARAVEYLQKNRALFQKEVHLPPAFALSYKRQDCFAQLSTLRPHMLTFTCESREDYMTFTRHVIDEQGLNVNVAEYSRTGKTRVADHPVPCSLETLKSFGLDCYIIDLLDGPEPVLNMLCHKANVHVFPIAFKEISSNNRRRITDAVDNKGDPLFRRLVDSRTIATIVKSRHGKRLPMVSERLLGPPLRFFFLGSNDEAKEEIQRTISSIDEELKVVEQDHAEALSEGQKLKQILQEKRTNLANAKAERDEIKRQEHTAKSLEIKLATSTSDLEKMDANPFDFAGQKERIESDIQSTLDELKVSSRELVNSMAQLVELEKAMYQYRIDTPTYANETRLYEKFGSDDVREAEARLREVNANLQQFQEKKRELKARVKRERDRCTDAEREEINVIYMDMEYTLEKLEDETRKRNAMLAVSVESGEELVIARYTKRAEEIASLQEKVERSESVSTNCAEQIREIRQAWEPELQNIVRRISDEFSNAFKLIKCRGKVELGNTDQGFKNWTMNIMVSFRENAEMQLLNEQRQSGGERALSTVFYLISLQGLTKSPFRVVDEINQGMDRKNERIVHSRIVNVACRDNSSQYFLITPKLLTDLEYHKKMKVHCIYSGNTVADTRFFKVSPSSLWNLVETARRLQKENAESDE